MYHRSTSGGTLEGTPGRFDAAPSRSHADDTQRDDSDHLAREHPDSPAFGLHRAASPRRTEHKDETTR